jgi:asparagine synthase (glutamine-hydrolysing)
MCGFAGFIGNDANLLSSDWDTLLCKMGQVIQHRGPDDSGIWKDIDAGVGLTHRRLSILDLTAAGHQPMASASERFIIVFNGEIYNHLDLREELERSGITQNWRGHSDTETLLAGFDYWGIHTTAQKTRGMFAFAVWDKLDHTLTLGRDRVGEKPLYYGWQGNSFLFGSELKALKVHPAFRAEIDRNALTLLMRYGYIPAPYSIYQGIKKLLPGTLLTVSLQQREESVQPFWDFQQVVRDGLTNPFVGSTVEAVDKLEHLLRSAVEQQMISDVPLGAFLSGGVDSSAIVALMQAQSSRPVKTFSIGFHEANYNEATYAKAVAKHIGTDHTELYVTAEQAMAVIPQIPVLYDEPFADSSQIPTFLVSQLARQHVTVSLSGDAGDELFGGYNRYILGQQLWGKLSHIPVGLRLLVAKMIVSVPISMWNHLLGPVQKLIHLLAHTNIGDKLHKGAAVMSAKTSMDLYHLLVSLWHNPENLVINAIEPHTLLATASQQLQADNSIHQMMALDTLTYLPDDILVKVDRAAMGVSLETRVPLLDHRVIEFAWQLPLSMKLNSQQSKWILRQVLYRYVPKELIERPKMGFGVPIDVWLRGPLRDWAESHLSVERLSQEGYFNVPMIREKLEEHLSGRRNWAYHLWNVLMFQLWLDSQQ